MTKKYDYAVFIGRFQPFHNGHKAVIEKALEIADRVIVLVGSSNLARSTRNPFTFEERRDMIWGALGYQTDSPVLIHQLADAPYDDNEWVQNVQQAVRNFTSSHVAPRVALVGLDKDNSTYYLRMFPQWTFVGLGENTLNATGIRSAYFADAKHMPEIEPKVPPQIFEWLTYWRGLKDFKSLWDDHLAYSEYAEKWGKGPHVTVDACVVASGHVLLVERGRWPGEGLLALPGGFLEPDESILQGTLRELEEETGLVLPYGVVAPLIRSSRVFDDPHRSQRGRIITHAFLFELPPGQLPAVKGADDAADAKWVELSSLRVADLFEDHAFIIQSLLKKGT